MVPKKNSKTTGGAAITLTGMLMNTRPRAEFIYIGPTQEVAEIAFSQTVGMIEADDFLAERFHIAFHTKSITDRRSKARLKIKTFDMKVVTGSKPSFVLLGRAAPDVDHQRRRQGDRPDQGRHAAQSRGCAGDDHDTVRHAAGWRLQERIAICPRRQGRAHQGRADAAAALGVSRGDADRPGQAVAGSGQLADGAAEPWNRSITLDRLVADYRTAVEKGDEEERRWARQHLNVEIGLALHDDRWPGVDFWEQSAAPGMTLDDLLAQCDVATIGIDGGGLDDLLGLAVIGRHAKTRHWLLWTKAWAHPIVLQRRKEIAETLRDFAKDGDLVFCSHSTQDIEEVAALCVKVRELKLLPERMGIGLDKLGLPGLIDALIDSGFDTDANEGAITGISQGGYLNPAIIGLERKLSDGTMVHAGQPLMAWCVSRTPRSSSRVRRAPSPSRRPAWPRSIRSSRRSMPPC